MPHDRLSRKHGYMLLQLLPHSDSILRGPLEPMLATQVTRTCALTYKNRRLGLGISSMSSQGQHPLAREAFRDQGVELPRCCCMLHQGGSSKFWLPDPQRQKDSAAKTQATAYAEGQTVLACGGKGRLKMCSRVRDDQL